MRWWYPAGGNMASEYGWRCCRTTARLLDHSITLFSPPGAQEHPAHCQPQPSEGWGVWESHQHRCPLGGNSGGCPTSLLVIKVGKEPRPGLEVKRQARRYTTIHYPLFTGFHLMWFDCTRFHFVSLDVSWFHLACIWFHLISFDFIWCHLNSFDFNWFQVSSIDFTWFHLI